MKKALILFIGIPSLVIMGIFAIVGFLSAIITTGFIFGKCLFEDFNEYIKKTK